MKNNHKNNSTITKIAAMGAVIALSIGLFPGSANAAETALSMGTASTYGVLASAAVTSATVSGVTGTEGANIGVGGGTAPSGPLNAAGTTVLGGISLAALTSASSALADNRGGTTTGVELGATTKTPGAYVNPTLAVNGTLTLDALGDPMAVFIFRSGSTLITGSSSTVLLTNGAQACNVYWQVGSSATLGATSTMVGHVIASASISTGLGSFVNGQLIATTAAVTLGGTTIVNNACAAPVVVAPTPVATPTTPVVTPAPVVTPTPVVEVTATPVPVTETGGTLPKTSSPLENELLIGAALIALGALGFAMRKRFAK